MANENNPSMKLINQFHDDHKWRQFHNAKDLALQYPLKPLTIRNSPMD